MKLVLHILCAKAGEPCSISYYINTCCRYKIYICPVRVPKEPAMLILTVSIQYVLGLISTYMETCAVTQFICWPINYTEMEIPNHQEFPVQANVSYISTSYKIRLQISSI